MHSTNIQPAQLKSGGADDPDNPAVRPQFSVIIPLEFHRGQWERCWHGWQTQSLPRSRYEVILVVPPDFHDHDDLLDLCGPQDRLEYSTAQHDIGLCAAGAARARGEFLFFTESHCWPEADVLEKCLHTLNANPEWAGFSCQSKPFIHNRLSRAEADMYQADIEFGLKLHPWRKVLDQCFVTRRDSYEACGGFKPRYGHFAEWVLAADYFRLGYKIGYAPEIHVNHYYVGEVGELRKFTRDFVTGEMTYFATEPDTPGSSMFEVPPEWICQGNWNSRSAQSILWMAVHDLLVPPLRRVRQPRLFLRVLARWLIPAIAGGRPARIGAAVKVGLARAGLSLAILAGSNAKVNAAFKTYVAALIAHQRLACLKSQRGAKAHTAEGWDVFACENAGFYPIETSQETRFRWSEPIAIMSARLPEGRHQVRIECLSIRSPALAGLRFYVNGRPLPVRDVLFGLDTIDVTFDLSRPGRCSLGWTCLRGRVKGDSRWLGLPIKRIATDPAGD